MGLFISYAHVDLRLVRDLVDALRTGGYDPWFDHRLIPGHPWKNQLGRWITECDAFIYALTPESVASEWCQWEFHRAVELGKPVIPVLLQPATILPPSLQQLQYVDFCEGATGDSVARLFYALRHAQPVDIVPQAPNEPRGLPARVAISDDEAARPDALSPKPPAQRIPLRKRTWATCWVLPILTVLILMGGGVALWQLQLNEDDSAQHAVATFECSKVEPTTVRLAIPDGMEWLETGIELFHAECPNITIDPQPAPNLASHHAYREMGAWGIEDYDVVFLDVVMPGMLGDALLPLELSDEERNQYFDILLANNTVEGQVRALPISADVPLLYYNKELLAGYGFEHPPETWDEFEEMATIIQTGERENGRQDFWGYLWTAEERESLTCVALEWQASSAHTRFVEANGEIDVFNPAWLDFLERAKSWVGRISPPEVLEINAEEVRAWWLDGRGAFMRQWSYAYSVARAESGSYPEWVGLAHMPYANDGAGGSTLGGMEIAVLVGTEHPEAAQAVARFFASHTAQIEFARQGWLMPSIRSLYDDADVVQSDELRAVLPEAIERAVVRPATLLGDRYLAASSVYYTQVYNVLEGEDSPEEAMERVEQNLTELLDS